MDRDAYNEFCRSLPNTTHVVQWGGADVWKISGKVFAIGGWDGSDDCIGVTFKCSEETFDLLEVRPGCRPAPYLASRGLSWIQRYEDKGMTDSELCVRLRESYVLVAQALSKRTQKELRIAELRREWGL